MPLWTRVSALVVVASLLAPSPAGATVVSPPTQSTALARVLMGVDSGVVGNGLTLVSAAMTGTGGTTAVPTQQYGTFSDAPDGLGMDAGVVLTTGNRDALLTGGNVLDWGDHPQASGQPVPADWLAANGGALPTFPAEPPFAPVAYDPAMLTLQVVPDGSYLEVDWAMLSEEFSSNAAGGANDGALVLVDTTWSGTPANPVDKNCALLPGAEAGQTVPAMVSTIDTASAWFSSDTTNSVSGFAGRVDRHTCRVRVVPGETVTIRFAVFDVQDGTFDSALVLAADSLRSDTPPDAVLTATPSSGTAPMSTTLSTAGTGDDESIASWRLATGDGTVLSGVGSPPSSFDHVYAAGPHTATLTVTDRLGQSGQASAVVTSTAPVTPGPSPTPSPAPSPTPTPPAVGPTLATPQKAAWPKVRKGLPVTLTCAAACSGTVVVTLPRRAAEALGITGPRTGTRVRVAKRTLTLAGPGRLSARIPFSASARRGFAGATPGRATLSVSLAGVTGTARDVRLRLG